MKRSINSINASQKVNMGGIILEQPLPHRGLDMVDPFLLIHHWDSALPGNQQQNEAGVGPHPHRGFTPVTFIFKGAVHHRDSTGHESIISAGGTQWMNSGKGIVHSERPAKELAATGGPFEIIQFWVNAPAKNKFDEPSYQPLTKENTPMVISEDKKISIGIASGELSGAKGSLVGNSPLTTLRIEAQKGGKTTIKLPQSFNVLIYLLDGSVNVNERVVKGKDLIVFNRDGDEIELEALENTRLILLSGEPINEPVVSYGPFVMNTEQEIMEAIRDYQSGKLGTLIEQD